MRIRRAIAKSGTPEAKRALAGTLNNAAILESAQGNQTSARSHAEEAIRIYKTLSQAELFAYGTLWVDASHVLAKILAEAGDLEGASEVIDESLAIMASIESGGGAVDLQSLARGYINLSAVLRERDELSRAQTVIKQGIDLLESNGRIATPRLAGAYTNLGAILVSLKSWPEAAHALRRAVVIHRDLTKLAAGAHDLNLSYALNNLGNVLNELGDLEGARAALEEAILIRRRLSEQEPALLLEYASALNSLGIVLYENGHLDEAEDVLRRAQTIDRDLYFKQPHICGESYAAVLNGLGRVLSYKNKLDEASTILLEAISIHEKLGCRKRGAGVFLNLGLIETVKGQVASSIAYFEEAIAGLEERVGNRDESTNRDKFKSDFDVAYRYLIHHYAVAGQSRGMRLVGALESQRRTTSLSWARRNTKAGTAEWKVLAEKLWAGSGQITTFFAQHSAVFIWIHCTDESVVIGLVCPGRMEFEAVDLSILTALSELDRQFRLLYRSPELVQQLTKRSFGESARQGFQNAGYAIFAKFPVFVQRALEDPKIKVVMVSACSKSIQFPFELIAGADGRYLGLVKVIARVRALSDIKGMIDTVEAVEHRAAIVGNPSHGGASNLPSSEQASSVLEARLRQDGWQTTCLLTKDATASAVLSLLRKRQALGLFTYMGHGSRLGGSSRLLLANGDTLCPDDLNGELRGGPLVHLDCCFAAATVGTGGGGFEGFPFAALDAGAGTVLSSFHPLDDRVAAEFSADLYDALLAHSCDKRGVGQCLQEARLRSDERYRGNPFAWSTTLLWGNPWVRL
jgi:tetratricopeptide (TPR) repeat protein